MTALPCRAEDTTPGCEYGLKSRPGGGATQEPPRRGGKAKGALPKAGVRGGKSLGVHAAGGGGFVERDAGEVWELGFEAFPEPCGDRFDGWLFEAGDVVEVVVVEEGERGGGGGFNVGEVGDPGLVGVEWASDVEDEAIGVTVESVTLVGGWEMFESVCRVEGEFAEDLVGHGGLLECAREDGKGKQV